MEGAIDKWAFKLYVDHFLPPSSPDFNPIEEAFSKIETSLRRAKARTKETLIEALGRELDVVSKVDASCWFAYCGYHVELWST